MSATSGGGGSVSEGSEAGSSSQSTMSVSDSPSTSFQTNLAENVTKITLTEEHTVGGFEGDLNGSKINLALDEKQQKDGIVNAAFDFEEGTNLGGNAGGDFKSINGSEKKDKVPEAVNLELVNMVPYSNGNGTSYGVPVNGIPTKKDSEQVDISTPYDEYFVPVNEHKKYMRGEKLYVTKDKRRPTSWRRCLSWVVACAVISVVLILAILAGTGVILSQEPNLVKEASVGRNFAGPNLKPSVTDKSPTPIAEKFMYVPRTIESEFVIDNLDFDPELKDTNSSAYKQFASTMEDQLKMFLLDKETLDFGASDVGLKVVNISRDPFKVNYRIGWNYKQGVNNPPEPIKMEDVRKRLIESLAKNQDYIDKYHIDREAIKVNHVINTCQMDNGGCSHICYYNYVTQQFTCTCPTHLVLDRNGKNCINWTGFSEDDVAPLPSHTAQPGMSHESTTNREQEHELNYGREDHQGNHFNFNNNENNFKSSSDPKFKGLEKEYQEHEPVAEPVPESTAEPSSDHKSGSPLNSEIENNDHMAVLEPIPEPNVKDPDHTIYGPKDPSEEHTANSYNKNQYDSSQFTFESKDLESSAEPSPEPNANSNNRDYHHSSHSVFGSDEHGNSAKSVTESVSESRSHYHDHSINEFKKHQLSEDPSKMTDSEYATGSSAENEDHKLTAKLLPKPVSEPTADENSSEKAYKVYGHSVNTMKDHEPAAEPTPEPVPEPTADGNSSEKDYDPNSHSVHIMKDHEPAAEPTPEPVPEPTADGNSSEKDYDPNSHSVHIIKDHEPAAEPTPEPVPEPTADGNSSEKDYDPNSHSVHIMKDHEPAAEPTPEPVPEPTADGNSSEKDYDPNSHSVHIMKDHEPTAEPTPEPTPEPTADGNSREQDYDPNGHSVHIMKEPGSEPAADGNSSEKDYDPNSHSVNIMKEPVSEPTADGNSSEKDYDPNSHSVNIMKNHEPAGEPTPEPTPEPTADGNSKEQDYDPNSHSVNIMKDHEPTAEPTPEPPVKPVSKSSFEGKTQGIVGYSGSEPKDYEVTEELIPEPISETLSEFETEGKNNDSVVYSLQGSKNYKSSEKSSPKHSSEGISHTQSSQNENKLKDRETVTETTFESGSKFNQPKLHSSNESTEIQFDPKLKKVEPGEKAPPEFFMGSNSSHSGGTEYDGRTIYSSIPQENTKLELNSSLNNLNHQSLPFQNKIETPESKTEYSLTSHSDMQNKPGENNNNNNSEHHVPYLEDILIRKPSPDLENQNGTNFSRNPLDNIERTPNGEPVIEEILIDKPGRKSTNQVKIDQTGNESDLSLGSKSGDIDNAYNRDGTATDYSDSSTTKGLVMTTEQDKDSKIQNTPTDHPKIVEYSAVQHLAPKKEMELETKTSDSGQTESSSFSSDSITKISDKDSRHSSIHFPSTGSFEDMTINSERKTVNLSQDNTPVTTTQPIIHHESYTVPVTVEFFNPADSRGNSEIKSNLDNETRMPEIHIRKEKNSVKDLNKNPGGFSTNEGSTETEYHAINDSHDIKTSSENVTNVHETATELFSTQRPKEMEKVHESLAKDLNVKKEIIESEKKTNIEHYQIENNETTKTPEEISNNIKDEVPDNEEFNTLLNKEFKNKEIISNEGKDITKYPSKSFKIEKKKLKDYIKGEKIDSDKKAEVTLRPAVTSEDFILQKHVNGNENNFDLDYSLLNEHTTKQDGEVTVIDPYGIEGIPGVSLKPYGINNHDISIFQTVAPDFRTETIFPNKGQEIETVKPDFKNKQPDNKEGESKLDKDYKFDKDYKYEKQKVSKKKDLKKKVVGKDGKNVELEEGRKYFTEISKDDWDAGQEVKDISETTMNPLEKITVQPEIGFKVVPGSIDKVTAVPEPTSFKVKTDGPQTIPISEPDHTPVFEMKTERQDRRSDDPDSKLPNKQTETDNPKFSEQATSKANIKLQENNEHLKTTSVNGDGHLMIDEPIFKSTFNESPGTVYDGQLSGIITSSPEIKHVIVNTSFTKEQETSGVPVTVIDRNSQVTTIDTASNTKLGVDGTTQDENQQNATFVVYESAHSLPKVIPEIGITNSTTAHPTIIIHGQSGNLQDGHTLRFANSTLHNLRNSTVISILNGTLGHQDGHSLIFTNYTTTSSNGSIVRPTIVIRGQSGTLQEGHELRFGNTTFPMYIPSPGQATGSKIYENSDVYKIENGSLPGTVFDGHFNPHYGHYHMFSNTSGTFVYTNASNPPVFVIKGESGDFGNATAYIIKNNTRSAFPEGFTVPYSVIFRNSTVFAVENTGRTNASIQEISAQPHEVTSNETIHYTHQMSPNFVSSGTAFEVNNYFGYISKCAAGQFQCVNGTSKRGSACISLSSKCDSINDCSDGSDELGCIENGCPGNFQCTDSTCLKRNLVCNGILECSDGSDEKNCESWKCEFDEFQCPSGRCIPVVWQCDSKPDCDNHTDEYNCQTSCGNDEYLCPEGWCIPLSYKCNGINECRNGEDEQLCDCSHEEFKCQTGGCVSRKQVCDGLDDCPDRSDEWDCVKLEPDSNLLKIKSPSGNYEPVCADNWSPQYSDKVCASLGYFSSVPIEKENSSITTEMSFYVLKNDVPADFNKKIIFNLRKSEGNCSSGKFVEIACQEFSCGSRSMTDSSSVEARLVGGMSATAGQWPSVALLYNIRNFHSCTANVLTPRWVLASYNCLKMGNKILNEQDWKFFGGSTVFEAEKENAETRKILSIIPHPQVKFNQFLFTNDLALVELHEALQFTNNLGAVCLPEQEMQPRQICVTAGWGINASEVKVIRQQLQYLPVPTMNLTECNSTEHYSGFITEDKICAGYNSAQKSLCYNEEGAPLMCVNDRGEWELQGVLSYHSDCGRGSHPSIFSSITPVADWIRKTIGNNFQRKALVGANR